MKRHLWLILFLLFSLLSMFGDMLNERFLMVDFEVYFRTAGRMLEGAEIYRIAADEHFVYKYAPAAGLYFLLFLLVGFGAAKVLYWLLLTAATAWGLWTMKGMLSEGKTERFINLALLGAILAVVPHIHLEWHLGQVNMLLMVAYIALIKFYRDRQDVRLGILLGASIFMKPFGLIFLPYFLLKKRLKAVAYTILALLVVGLLPFVFYPSWDEFSGLYAAWFNELGIEMAAKQALTADANHTIFSVLARYTPIRYALVSDTAQTLYQLTVLGMMGLAFLWYMRRGRDTEKAFIGELALLAAWIPLLAFTSQNAFIYTMPLAIYLIFSFGKLLTWEKILLIIGCFLLGINMYDVVGESLHWQLMQGSIYTFGSLCLTVLAFSIRRKMVRSILK